MAERIVRTLCYFSDAPDAGAVARLRELDGRLQQAGFTVQTRRLCGRAADLGVLDRLCGADLPGCLGTLDRGGATAIMDDFLKAGAVSFNLDLGAGVLDTDADFLFRIIRNKPSKTFQFTYTFNNPHSSPYFPSAHRKHNGFSLGLQPTNLAAGCTTLQPWLQRMQKTWDTLCSLLDGEPDFLGIDSSIAPLSGGDGSLVAFIRRLHGSFADSVTTDTWLHISSFIKEYNPRPAGLCGIMLPCLEDDELAAEYAAGGFSVERNIYLSLHSGLGVDTYPVGVDEKPEKILDILRTLQGLSNKYTKPLSARFVSDGRARTGETTDFGNPYLKDVVIRPL
jgi:hypothetical protein